MVGNGVANVLLIASGILSGCRRDVIYVEMDAPVSGGGRISYPAITGITVFVPVRGGRGVPVVAPSRGGRVVRSPAQGGTHGGGSGIASVLHRVMPMRSSSQRYRSMREGSVHSYGCYPSPS